MLKLCLTLSACFFIFTNASPSFAKNAVTTQKASFINPSQTPFSTNPRKDYGVHLGNCRGAVIAPSWILTAKHCITDKRKRKPGSIPARFFYKGGAKERLKASAVYLYKKADLALIQLTTPIHQSNVLQPVLLLGTPLKAKHGSLPMKKLSVPIGPWKNIPVRAGKKQNAYISKEDRRGGPGTSGSPWIFETAIAGDVLFAVTHGSGRGVLVAYARKWLDKTVKRHTPGEKLHWIRLNPLLPDLN
ncbi:trypsin-like serine protease [Veronia pacifica]|nr:trypsin-like serine protease [Veronia pacifica]